MKMLSLKQAETQALNCRTANGTVEMEFLTFKRDRGVKVAVTPTSYNMEEHGYRNESSEFALHADFKRAVKDAFKREFPRSHQVYFNRVNK